MANVLVPIGLTTALLAVGYYWRLSWLREKVGERLQSSVVDDVAGLPERPFATKHPTVPWLIAVTTTVMLAMLLAWPLNISIGIGLITALALAELDAWFLEWRYARIETQLADTIDVLVASVRSGASLQTALENASVHADAPLRDELEELVARLRLGDAASDVFDLLRQRVPLETFRLFTTALTLNWEVGGALAETLATVGQTIRDRLAVARQIRTLSTQGRISTLAVLAVTYFLAAMMWQSDPWRMIGFVTSAPGSWLISVGLVMQAVGIALVARFSRPKV